MSSKTRRRNEPLSPPDSSGDPTARLSQLQQNAEEARRRREDFERSMNSTSSSSASRSKPVPKVVQGSSSKGSTGSGKHGRIRALTQQHSARNSSSSSSRRKQKLTDSSGCSYTQIGVDRSESGGNHQNPKNKFSFPLAADPEGDSSSVILGGMPSSGGDGGGGGGNISSKDGSHNSGLLMTHLPRGTGSDSTDPLSEEPDTSNEHYAYDQYEKEDDDDGEGGEYCYSSGPASLPPPPPSSSKGGGWRCFNTAMAKLEALVETRFGPLLLALLVIIGLGIGTAVYLTQGGDALPPDYVHDVHGNGWSHGDGVVHPHAADMTPEEVAQRSQDILSILEQISDENDLTDASKHQFWASQWLLHNDAMVLPADSPYLIQRYVLALLYYELDMDNEVLLPKNGETSDGRVWVGPTWECSWIGVDCSDDSYVTEIQGLQGLVGQIPREIAALGQLKVLDLSGNAIHGGVPTEMGLLGQLTVLRLDDNELTGSVPDGLCRQVDAGTLREFTTDCNGRVTCDCCTSCGDGSAGGTWSSSSSTIGDFDSISGKYSNDERKKGIVEALEKVSSSRDLNRQGTPQNLALEWILNEDDMKLTALSANLVQRYVVALFYYSLGGPDWPYLPWLEGNESECNFHGLACNRDGNVVDISLVSSGLSGIIPDEIRELSDLINLDLTANVIKGNLPDSIADLKQLGSLLLQDNMITGSVSGAICDLRTDHFLSEIRVDCDTDKLEISCSCCDNCESSFSNNKRPSPSSTASDTTRDDAVKKVLQRQFQNTSEDGRKQAVDWIINDDPKQIDASDFARLIQRYVLAVMFFTMGGENWSVQPWIGGRNGSKNECDWDGVACDDLGEVVGLALSSSNLRGKLPPEISALSSIKAIDFSDNRIEGGVPGEYGDLKSLELLILHDNEIEGTVPNVLCENKKAGGLVVLWFDCAVGDAKVHCPCCTHCR